VFTFRFLHSLAELIKDAIGCVPDKNPQGDDDDKGNKNNNIRRNPLPLSEWHRGLWEDLADDVERAFYGLTRVDATVELEGWETAEDVARLKLVNAKRDSRRKADFYNRKATNVMGLAFAHAALAPIRDVLIEYAMNSDDPDAVAARAADEIHEVG